MTTHSLHHSDLVDFDHAAAGHFGLLTDPSGGLVVKPCSAAEAAFYETCAAQHPDFAALIPTFMGRLNLSTPEQRDAVLSSSTTKTDEPKLDLQDPTLLAKSAEAAAKAERHGTKLETEQAIVLENVAAGFVKPNILDVKLGGRLWGDDAQPAKRVRLDKVSGETTSGTLGFRIAGMRVWRDSSSGPEGASEGGEVSKSTPEEASTGGQVDGQAQSGPAPPGEAAYDVYDKTYGRSLTLDTVNAAFETFFRANDPESKELSPHRHAILALCAKALEPIESVLASKESRMYSASILIVSEGDDAALALAFQKFEEMQKHDTTVPKSTKTEDNEGGEDAEDDESDEEEEAEKLPKICAIKLIDFAHARWAPGEGPDENMLQGVRSVRRILGEMLGADEQ